MSPSPSAARTAPQVELRSADQHMLDDVVRGLSAPNKWLSSIYFYDQRGSQLFEQICDLPEYYPTRTELSILRTHIGDMAELMGPRASLIELGSGSSHKTRIPLEHMHEPVAYVPVDISRQHLQTSAAALRASYPDIEILPVCADFTQPFEVPLATRPSARSIVYFPGSTIGNFEPARATALLGQMADLAGPSGGVLIGVDLEKDVDILERAYNDSAGVTARFNLNLLRRLNRELGADFDLDAYSHRAVWNPAQRRIEMHLVSARDQSIHIDGYEFSMRSGESIHTESSYKYTLPRFAALAIRAGLTVVWVWTDPRTLFSVIYLESAAAGRYL